MAKDSGDSCCAFPRDANGIPVKQMNKGKEPADNKGFDRGPAAKMDDDDDDDGNG